MLVWFSYNLNFHKQAALLFTFLFVGCGQQTEGGLLQSNASINGMFLVSEIEPDTALPGTTIIIKGVGFSADLKVSIDGQEVTVTSRTADKAMSVSIPEGKPGMTRLSVFNSKDKTNIKFVRLSPDGFPVVANDSATNFCKGSKFYSMEGILLEGERTCETPLPFCSEEGQTSCITSETFPVVERAKLQAENFKAGLNIAGIEGTLTAAPVLCTADAEVGCITSEQVKAVKLSEFSAGDVKDGVTIGGILGTHTNILPPVCAANGADNCMVQSPYKALNPSTIDASKMLASQTILGTTGAIVDRSNWNLSAAFPGAGYYASVSNAPLAALRSSASINGTPGTLSDCGADGSNCFLPAYVITTQPRKAINYDTIDTSKMLASQTIADKTGTIAIKGSWNVTTAFPGTGYYTGVSNIPLADLKSTAAISGTSGTLTTCTANGSNCFLPAYALSTQPKKAIDYDAIDADKMLSTQTIDGKTGTIVSRGTLDVAAAFPGVGIYNGVTNAPTSSLLSTATINGIAGTVANCSNDGSACYLPAYVVTTQPKKAINYDTIDANKMLSTLTVSGKVGTIATRGSWDLTASFPGTGYYTGVTNAPTAALLSSSTINGTNGLINDCALNGTNCFLPTYAAGTQPKKAIDYDAVDTAKMLTTMTIDGKTGTIETKGALDVSLSFPGAGVYTGIINAPTASLLSSASINGVVGGITNCGADGSACYLPAYVTSTQPKKAIDYDAIDVAKMLTTMTIGAKTGTIETKGALDLTLAFPGTGVYTSVTNAPTAFLLSSANINGVAGGITNCGADGSACYLPAYVTSTQPKKAIDYDAIDTARMLSTQTVSGKTGTISTRGSWDLTTSFPGTGYFTGVSNAPTSSLRSSTTINGVSGAINDCASDSSNCFVPTYAALVQPIKALDYDAVDVAKMLATQTIGTKTGTIVSQGLWDISSSFPGAGFYSGISNAPLAHLRPSATINGSAGTLPTCGADGSGCYLPAYVVSTQPLKAISYDNIDANKMLTTLTLSGVSGNITNRGSWNLTTSFPGTGYYSAVTNVPAITDIKNSVSIIGVTGNVIPTPAVCIADAEIGCVTNASYKAAKMTNVLVGNIKATIQIAGVTGTYGGGASEVCTFDGDIGCLVNGTAFIAADVQSATPGNIRKNVQIAGTTGSYSGGASVSIVEPTGNNDFVTPGASFNINFYANRPISDPVGTIDLYYRGDGIKTGCSGNPLLQGWTLLVSDLDDTLTTWPWPVVPRGTHNICAVFDNVVNQAYEVSSGKINAKDSTIFASTTTYRGGDIASLTNGDTICRSLASAGSLPFSTSYQVILSNDFIHAKDRLELGARIYNTKNEIVSTVTNFWSGNHSFAVFRLDQSAPPGFMWTGTTGFGHSTGEGCANWSNSTAGIYGTAGNAASSNYYWATYGWDACNTYKAIYCIGDR